MKPSHLSTPRTLAECQFTTGYQTCHYSDRPTFPEFLIYALIGAVLASPVVAWIFGSWN